MLEPEGGGGTGNVVVKDKTSRGLPLKLYVHARIVGGGVRADIGPKAAIDKSLDNKCQVV